MSHVHNRCGRYNTRDSEEIPLLELRHHGTNRVHAHCDRTQNDKHRCRGWPKWSHRPVLGTLGVLSPRNFHPAPVFSTGQATRHFKTHKQRHQINHGRSDKQDRIREVWGERDHQSVHRAQTSHNQTRNRRILRSPVAATRIQTRVRDHEACRQKSKESKRKRARENPVPRVATAMNDRVDSKRKSEKKRNCGQREQT